MSRSLSILPGMNHRRAMRYVLQKRRNEAHVCSMFRLFGCIKSFDLPAGATLTNCTFYFILPCSAALLTRSVRQRDTFVVPFVLRELRKGIVWSKLRGGSAIYFVVSSLGLEHTQWGGWPRISWSKDAGDEWFRYQIFLFFFFFANRFAQVIIFSR